MGLKPVFVAGAGLSGAVVARCLAEAGYSVNVIEKRAHVAGNCHTERDPDTGVMVHRYGPHIFHTDDKKVLDFVSRFASFQPYRHQVQTTVDEGVYTLPINLGTINQFYGQMLRPDEAQAFIKERAIHFKTAPDNFEDQAMSMIGPDLYNAFFKGYTEKQWGCSPRELPASIHKRLPLRFDYNISYFTHGFQGLPENGYTECVERMLGHPNIAVTLNTAFGHGDASANAHTFWTGPLDGFFACSLGHLGYRTLDFEDFTADGDWQGCPVMNYGDTETPYTRITEHKHFAPWERHDRTVCSREYSRHCEAGDTPYYPIRLVNETALLRQYTAKAKETTGVTFLGRLGTYRYLDMDACIHEALNAAEVFLDAEARGDTLAAFIKSPL